MTERFDLYDANGRPLGTSKDRALVHRDGDWHRSVALWIVRPDGSLVFQRRSATKDTWPKRLTASVSGHYAAGETLAEVLREAKEEVGRPVEDRDLIPLGLWRHDEHSAPGVRDRELQDVFLWPLSALLTTLHPDPEEVSALIEMRPGEVLRLLHDPLASSVVPCLLAGEDTLREIRVSLADFVPAHELHARVAQAAMAYAEGQAPTLGEQLEVRPLD